MADDPTARAYAEFARTGGDSPSYTALTGAIAEHEPTLAWLRTLPQEKRQPNLLLGALRWLGAALTPVDDVLSFVAEHHDELWAIIREHRTQTNEVGRCAAIALALGRIDGPVALVEVGASAGLNLLLDRYAVDYGEGRTLGPADAPVRIDCPLLGAGAPERLPEIAWRAGLDANPLDPRDADVRRWLGCLVWPEDVVRQERLAAALDLAAVDPPRVVAADAAEGTAQLLAEVPAGLTPVVVHTVVFPYLDETTRAAVRGAIAHAGAHEVALEPPGHMPGLETGPVPDDPRFVLALDDVPLAYGHSHGRWLRDVAQG